MKNPRYRTESSPLNPDHLVFVCENTGETQEVCAEWAHALWFLIEALDEYFSSLEDETTALETVQHFEKILKEVFLFFTTRRPVFGSELQNCDIHELYSIFIDCVEIHEELTDQLDHYTIWYSTQKEAPFWIDDATENFFVVFCNRDYSYPLLDKKEIPLLASEFNWSQEKTQEVEKAFQRWSEEKQVKLN